MLDKVRPLVARVLRAKPNRLAPSIVRKAE